jgi:hypothetical protein
MHTNTTNAIMTNTVGRTPGNRYQTLRNTGMKIEDGGIETKGKGIGAHWKSLGIESQELAQSKAPKTERRFDLQKYCIF